jgi:DEAD/DEAH box helicase domain-containing protein
VTPQPLGRSSTADWLDVIAPPGRIDRVTHVERTPARAGHTVDWPQWSHRDLVERWRGLGIERPWTHQRDFADLLHSGTDAVIATGTASGKSLAYWLPTLTTLLEDPSATVLHLSPTKALTGDQWRALSTLDVDALGLRPATYDGDTETEERRWVRRHARYVLTNPDMLHHGILPAHARFARMLRGLRYVIVDEAHAYRGVFGAHVALVLRRLDRLCAFYGSRPVFALASATMAHPERSAARLTGRSVVAITDDASPAAARTFALWEPPPVVNRLGTAATSPWGEADEAIDTDLATAAEEPRRSALAETADLLTDLVVAGARTLAFVRSRRAAESVAAIARDLLADVDPELPDRVAAYRGGYLAEERRDLESRLRSGDLLGVATTNALELGIDVSGLDAVLITGWPGTRASVLQQSGRAGRSGRTSLSVLVARDDPLDRYLVHHPETLFGQPLEETVFDPGNPYVLGPHLCAAAAELPLTTSGPASIEAFEPRAADIAVVLERQGALRRRKDGWFWTSRDRATDLADLRGTGGAPIRIVEESTGRLLGTVDASSSHRLVHPGAIYVHQGAEHLVLELSDEDSVAIVRRIVADHSTHARSTTDVAVLESSRRDVWGDTQVHVGMVDVTTQVIGFVRRRKGSGERLGEVPLDLPARTLRTASTWWTLTDDAIARSGIEPMDLPGAAHAAEHAAIGLLPLLATCDRRDLGGLSTVRHPDTGLLTVFVHDAVPGGAGFAERGFMAAARWWRITRDAIDQCPCASGCPACIQSPKCGNGNDPLNKAGAVALLDTMLRDAPVGDEA